MRGGLSILIMAGLICACQLTTSWKPAQVPMSVFFERSTSSDIRASPSVALVWRNRGRIYLHFAGNAAASLARACNSSDGASMEIVLNEACQERHPRSELGSLLGGEIRKSFDPCRARSGSTDGQFVAYIKPPWPDAGSMVCGYSGEIDLQVGEMERYIFQSGASD